MYEPITEAYKPAPRTRGEFDVLIDNILDAEHSYNTVPEAMTDAALGAFNFISSKLGATGFQASWADLNFFKRSRNIKAPFMIVNLDDELYPQCDPLDKVCEFIEKNRDWLRTEAQKLLNEENKEYPAHPDVLAHWRKLANA
jgi:hypothetical protein